ncbi:hypothetical protein [Planosporangium flavigriseum]|nr:hypothetical protein [Planosporangium flavigriseum]
MKQVTRRRVLLAGVAICIHRGCPLESKTSTVDVDQIRLLD